MLKLTYTEDSFYLECLILSLEEWVTQRVILTLRVGQNLCVQPSTAAFLLPLDLPGMEALKLEARRGDSEIINLSNCDPKYLEVTLRGTWLSEGSEDADGVFVTAMSDRTEFFLHKLWQASQACASAIGE